MSADIRALDHAAGDLAAPDGTGGGVEGAASLQADLSLPNAAWVSCCCASASAKGALAIVVQRVRFASDLRVRDVHAPAECVGPLQGVAHDRLLRGARVQRRHDSSGAGHAGEHENDQGGAAPVPQAPDREPQADPRRCQPALHRSARNRSGVADAAKERPTNTETRTSRTRQVPAASPTAVHAGSCVTGSRVPGAGEQRQAGQGGLRGHQTERHPGHRAQGGHGDVLADRSSAYDASRHADDAQPGEVARTRLRRRGNPDNEDERGQHEGHDAGQQGEPQGQCRTFAGQCHVVVVDAVSRGDDDAPALQVVHQTAFASGSSAASHTAYDVWVVGGADLSSRSMLTSTPLAPDRGIRATRPATS